MERLTFEGNFCDIAMCAEMPCKYPDGGCSQKQVWERLKAYEDTGLEPSDVPTALEMANVFCAMKKLKAYEDAESKLKERDGV